jgi:hypothetical protein
MVRQAAQPAPPAFASHRALSMGGRQRYRQTPSFKSQPAINRRAFARRLIAEIGCMSSPVASSAIPGRRCRTPADFIIVRGAPNISKIKSLTGVVRWLVGG